MDATLIVVTSKTMMSDLNPWCRDSNRGGRINFIIPTLYIIYQLRISKAPRMHGYFTSWILMLQERRGYLFCQEDRAILCRECDVPIHSANEHTQKHNRFLLSGVKLSSNSLDTDSSSTTSNGSRHSKPNIIPRSVRNENASSSSKFEDMASDTGSVSTSSISEYLIETLPGYCFEDFLDASFPPNGFCKV